MSGNNFSPDQLLKLLMNSKGASSDSNMAQDILQNKITPEQRQRVQNILQDKNALEALLKSPQAQELMKKIGDAYPYASVKRDAQTPYEFENKADVTVVHIGSEGKSADEFYASYKALLEMIREKNGKACRIVCVYNSSDSVAASAITGICGELGGETAGVYAIGVGVKDSGAMSTQEQKALADAISATVDKAIKTEIDFGNIGADDEVGNPDINIDHNDPAWKKQD